MAKPDPVNNNVLLNDAEYKKLEQSLSSFLDILLPLADKAEELGDSVTAEGFKLLHKSKRFPSYIPVDKKWTWYIRTFNGNQSYTLKSRFMRGFYQFNTLGEAFRFAAGVIGKSKEQQKIRQKKTWFITYTTVGNPEPQRKQFTTKKAAQSYLSNIKGYLHRDVYLQPKLIFEVSNGVQSSNP